MSSHILDLWDQGPVEGLVQYSSAEVLNDQTGDDQRLNRVYSNVSHPTITVHRAAKERATGAAVVVFPGGAYRDVWIDKEGHDIARWLNLFGVTAIVVKYRTAPIPALEDVRDKVLVDSLADAKRAMRLVRYHADEWGIDPNRLGTIGFSAGGHLIIRLAGQADNGSTNADDPVERMSSRSNFTIPIYPAVPPDLSDLGADVGPMFVVNGGQDELTPAEGAMRLCSALLEAEIPVELHLFRQGEHGFGLGITGGATRQWMDLCETWMRELGYLALR
jgi:acetyl esterase/lipase